MCPLCAPTPPGVNGLPVLLKKKAMQGPPIDMAALNAATADLMKLANGDRSVGRIAMLKLESEGEAMLEKNMTPSERAARAAKQDAHAAKLRAQRSELEAKEAAMEAERRKAAANHIAGTMGIGRVAVDVGDVRSAYEYEIHFDTLELYVPLPASVTKANQLSVDVSPRQLSIGLKGERQPFLKGTFKGTVHSDDTVWTLEKAHARPGSLELKLEISKTTPGQHWPGALELPDGWCCRWAQPPAVPPAAPPPAKPALLSLTAPPPGSPNDLAPLSALAGSSRTLEARMVAVRPSLLESGYAILDDALDAPTAALLRAELGVLKAKGALRAHQFGFKDEEAGVAQVYTKPHIWEAETTDASVAEAAPRLLAALESLAVPRAAAAAFPTLQLVDGRPLEQSAGATGVVVKLQCNEGAGGCFPLHYDNAGPPSRRRLTCLFYLSVGWSEMDGGELQLVPWLGAPVTIAPLSGRCVLFLSDIVLHRVLPCRHERFCFTIWMDAIPSATNRPEHLRLDVRTVRDPAADLRLHAAQRLLSRAVYDEEYARSLSDCFEGAPAVGKALLAAHSKHVHVSRSNAAFSRLADQARALKLVTTPESDTGTAATLPVFKDSPQQVASSVVASSVVARVLALDRSRVHVKVRVRGF